jgi:hypothetical protein
MKNLSFASVKPSQHSTLHTSVITKGTKFIIIIIIIIFVIANKCTIIS